MKKLFTHASQKIYLTISNKKKSHVTSAYEFTSSKYFYIYYFNYYNIAIGEDEMPFLFLKFLLISRQRILE